MPSRDTSLLDAALDPMPGPALCIGLSGGLDSATLLHVLAQRCRRDARALRAVHVHHGLSAHADAWVAACEAMCASLEVPLVVRRVHVDAREGQGIEAAARDARRAAFADVLEPGEVLVLAHHRDDQAETVLLRALRGSGPDGLGAMQAWRPFARGHLWRPWLDRPRALIEAHARAHDLRWIEDDSNASDRFDRNYLRHHVMPLLHARWPHASDALATSAAHCRDATRLLDHDDALALAAMRVRDTHALSIMSLGELPSERRGRVLRAWIASLGLPPLPRTGVQRIEVDLLNARADASASFAWHGAIIQAWRDLLHARRLREPLASTWHATWTGDGVYALPDGGTLALDGIAQFDSPVVLRARSGGERITLPGRTHSHSLKHVLQEWGIAPWTRAHLPLILTSDGDLLAAGDLIYSASFTGWLGDRGARLIWTQPHD